ncbi:23S rRNA (cytosine1962-C5)-methyltransferase [Lachnospiraceae bacterium NE2001]|nr:23S rRNA (cytosine1962-C5)-methyltransferase [Lachnospiraceae bacterium NE2001]
MILADRWKDYEVLDCTDGEKLERWGEYILLRPDPQVIWSTKHRSKEWKSLNGHYHRSSRGGGEWEFFSLPEEWQVQYQLPSEGITGSDIMTFNLKPFSFKHTGIFPEQAANWDYIFETIKAEIASRSEKGESTEIKALNLFAYTGGATLAAAMAGAKVTHVDASKGMTGWAKENAKSSGLEEAPIRWLIDDCIKFVEREIRRGNKYHVIIMDPPSYGRGPKGEMWKMEDNIFELIQLTSQILADDAIIYLINMYTTGLSPAVLNYMIGETVIKAHGGIVTSEDIGLMVRDTGLILPCGSTARWTPFY